jgi:hypothetical protein
MKITKQKLLQIIKEEVSFVSSNPMLSVDTGVSSYPIPAPKPDSIDPDGYEGRMAKTNLFKMEEYSRSLQGMIADNENLEPWVQEKIAVAASMIESVAHYLQYDKSHPQSGE